MYMSTVTEPRDIALVRVPRPGFATPVRIPQIAAYQKRRHLRNPQIVNTRYSYEFSATVLQQ